MTIATLSFSTCSELLLAIYTFKENHSDFVKFIGIELQTAFY